MSDEYNRKLDQQQEDADTEYAFLQETIKGDQMNGRKFFRKVLRVVSYGFLFGAALVFGAVVFGPFANNIRNSSSGEVTLYEDESVKEENKESEDSGKESETVAEEEKEDLKLNADNYMQIYRRLREVRTTAEASLADVRGYASNDSDDAVFESYGCVIAKNNRHTLLMTCSEKINKASRITVTFFGGEECAASVRGKYDILNLAVVEVPMDQMSKTTRSIVKTAGIGTSAGVAAGDPVITLGNIYGFTDSVGYGMIQDVSGKIRKEDGVYYRIQTDVRGAEHGSGIMLNLQGDVIGVISDVSADENKKEYAAGIGISDLKPILEFLLNGKEVPYVGIVGTDVTEETAAQQEMPEGVYVQSVSADSPAMSAGVKNGDIFTKVNDEKITTLDDFHRALMMCDPESEITVEGMRLGNEGYVEMSFNIRLN